MWWATWNADTTNLTWATLDVTSGSLAPNEQKTVNVSVDTSTFSISNYIGNIVFNYDDTKSTSIEVDLVVATRPPTWCSFSDINFGTMSQNTQNTKQTTIGNCGEQPLTWSVDTGGTNWVSLDTTSGTLEPQQQLTLTITADTSKLIPNVNAIYAQLTFNSAEAGVGTMNVSVLVPPPSMIATPMSLNPPGDPNCSTYRVTCTVTLQNNGLVSFDWSAPPISGVGFQPDHGSLTPNDNIVVTVSFDSCSGNATLTFNYGTNSYVQVPWNCTPPDLVLAATTINTSDPACTYSTSKTFTGWQCTNTVSIEQGATYPLYWTASTNGSTDITSISPDGGTINPGDAGAPVTIFINGGCQSNQTITFSSQVRTQNVTIVCPAPPIIK